MGMTNLDALAAGNIGL